MRKVMIGLLACGIATGACGQAETSAAAATAPAGSSAAAPAVPADSGAPAAAGRAEAAAATFHEVTIPAGTRLPIVLDTPVASDTSRVEQAVHAHLSQPIVVHG